MMNKFLKKAEDNCLNYVILELAVDRIFQLVTLKEVILEQCAFLVSAAKIRVFQANFRSVLE